MKKINLLCLFLSVVIMACAVEPTQEAKNIVQNGAKAKLTFLVKDSTKNPVTNVNVIVEFRFLGRTKNHTVKSITNTNGVCVVEGLCSQELGARFTKDGYYSSGFGYKYLTTYPNLPNVKDGKWQPWNPMVKITLKEKRKPIPMYVRYIVFKFPKNETIGFDCEKGDWVKPFGIGETSDFTIFMNPRD